MNSCLFEAKATYDTYDGSGMCVVFYILIKDHAKPYPASKVTVWLTLEHSFLATNVCPRHGCQRRFKVFLGFTGKTRKCKDAKSSAQHQKSETVGPFNKQV